MATKIWVGTDSGNEGDWNTAANWSPSGVPGTATTDDIYFENSSQSVTSSLDQSAETDINSLTIDQSYTGSIGTADAYLQINAPTVAIGQHNGPGTPTGSPFIRINLGSTSSDVSIYNSGTSADSSVTPIIVKGSGTDNTLSVYKGKVAFGTDTGDTTSVLKTLVVRYTTKPSTDADVFIGPLASDITDVTVLGGETYLECGVTGYDQYDGVVYALDGAGITTCNVHGGTLAYSATGSITTLTLVDSGTGTVDFTGKVIPHTITNAVSIGQGGSLKFYPEEMTFTGGLAAGSTKEVTTISAV